MSVTKRLSKRRLRRESEAIRQAVVIPLCHHVYEQNESCLTVEDLRARAEGQAIALLSLLRPHEGNPHDSILWNKNQHRLDVQRAMQRTEFAHLIFGRVARKFFARKSCRTR